MRHSRLLIPTLKEAPAEVQAVWQQLLLRGGFARRAAAGALSWLPLGMRVRQRVARIIREELAHAGAAEVQLAAVGDQRPIVDLVRREVRSYRQLPLHLFQELGVATIDGWSFHADDAGRAYLDRHDACARIFRRCGLTVRVVEAGAAARAFFVAVPFGDDRVLRCDGCDYAAMAEHAELGRAAKAAAATEPLAELHTPGKGSLADVVAFLGGAGAGLDAAHFVKTLVYTADGAPLLALVRGDRDVDEAKLQAAVGAETLTLAPLSVVREVTGAEVGYAGAQGRSVPVWADYEVAALPSALTGANRTDYHVRGFNLAREAPGARVVDLRGAVAGDACGRCAGGHYREERGLRLGGVARSSAPCTFRDADGSDKPMGLVRDDLDVARIVGAVVAQHHDADGARWPMALAPFQVLIVTAGGEPELAAAGAALETELTTRGIEVLYDDRDERAGAKFKDADLVGIPLRVTVGKRGLGENKLELKVRGDKETTMVPKDEIATELSHRVQEALS